MLSWSNAPTLTATSGFRKRKRDEPVENKTSPFDSNEIKQLTGTWTRQQIQVPTMTVHQSVEKSFVNSIERMIHETKAKSHPPGLKNPLIRDLMIKINNTNDVQERDPSKINLVTIPCVTKEYEDSYLTACVESETPCSRE